MLPPRTARGRTRGGVAIPEAALLMSIFLMFLFGVFEYSRYIFMQNILTSAARDTARYASVRSSEVPDALTNPDVVGMIEANDTTYASTQPVFTVPAVTNYLTARATLTVLDMVKPKKNGAADVGRIQIYPCDSASIYADPPVFRPKTQATPASAAWNNAGFTERIAVRVTGTYQPILPNLLFMQGLTTVELVVVVGSGG